ncbi:hypothetical protein [Methylobacterium crusticola]|uniref:hypothetical protein n=1 Tax=Methylobacterium crusticola TaxID=1697972 RepID=UPI000FFB2BC4|nr:hypothetical protein [Methylobacterium crusticola]
MSGTADSARILTVTGEVALGNADEWPGLGPSEPPGPDPAILNLDLEVATDGPGALAPHWAAIRFAWPLPAAGPSSVRVMWMGVEVAFLPVAED